MEMEKSFSKVEVYSKEVFKMI